jgi:hypothetical protein
MSKVAITGNASGTGVFTIASPNSNSDRTLNLPDSAGTIATAESTLVQFNASGSAPVYACRAWVNFNGTGTVAIRASGNVSSITDDGTGQYRMNFTTAMPDADYGQNISMAGNSDGANTFSTNTTTNSYVPTTTYAVICTKFNGSVYDTTYVHCSIFR